MMSVVEMRVSKGHYHSIVLLYGILSESAVLVHKFMSIATILYAWMATGDDKYIICRPAKASQLIQHEALKPR